MRRALVAVTVLLAVPAPAAAATDPLWRVTAESSGSYLLDYGDDGDVVDGQGSGTWEWRMRAIAEGPKLDTGLAIFRMSVTETSDIAFDTGGAFCRPPASGSVGWVRDSRVGLYISTSTSRPAGFQLNHPFFDLLGGCHTGAHGMSLYDGAQPEETPIPRGSFRPRRSRTFKRTWEQHIALDPGHAGMSDSPHSFRVDGSITIAAKRISKRAARKLRAQLRKLPRS